MLKNNKFNKFVSVLCSSLVLSSVALVIKHAHADPLFTITKSADGRDCLKLTENVLFVVVTARDIEKTKQMYKNMICKGLELGKKATFDVEAIPETDLNQNLLKLLENQPKDRPVALVVDFNNTEQSPKNHKLQYAFAVKDSLAVLPNTTGRYYDILTEMPEESSLNWSDTAEQKKKNLEKLFLVIERKPRSCEDKTEILVTTVVKDHFSSQLNFFGEPTSQMAPTALPYLKALKTVSVGQLLDELPRKQQPNMAPAIN